METVERKLCSELLVGGGRAVASMLQKTQGGSRMGTSSSVLGLLFIVVVAAASVDGSELSSLELVKACLLDGTCAVLDPSCVLSNSVLNGLRQPLWLLALSDEALESYNVNAMPLNESPRRLLRMDEEFVNDLYAEMDLYENKPAPAKPMSLNRVPRSAQAQEKRAQQLKYEELRRRVRDVKFLLGQLPQTAGQRFSSSNGGYHVKYPPAVRVAARVARLTAVRKEERQSPRLQYIPDHPEVFVPGQTRRITEDDNPDFKDFVYYAADGSFTIEHYRYNATCFPKTCNEGVEFYPHPKHCDRYYICNPDLNIPHLQFCPRHKKFDYKLSLCVGREQLPQMFCDPYIDCSGSQS